MTTREWTEPAEVTRAREEVVEAARRVIELGRARSPRFWTACVMLEIALDDLDAALPLALLDAAPHPVVEAARAVVRAHRARYVDTVVTPTIGAALEELERALTPASPPGAG